MEKLTDYDIMIAEQGLVGLGRIDREELKKNIIDLVTTNIFSWKKPWKPLENEHYFTKVKGKVVAGVINGYSMKTYKANSIQLAANLDFFNHENGTNFAPIFVPLSMVRRNKWSVKMVQDFFVYERFWVKVKDEEQIKKIKEYKDENEGALPYGVREKDGEFFRLSSKKEEVVLAETIEGNPLQVERIETNDAEMIEYVDKVLDAVAKNIAPVFLDQTDRCFYSPMRDEIHMVAPRGFGEINEYYSTRLHESTHSTLHKTRLNRDFGSKTWGDPGYAIEELVAEISSFMLCCELGIKYYRKDKAKPFSTKENSMAYIASWLKEAKKLYGNDDEKTLVAAYGYAEKAADWILKDVDLDAFIPERIKEMEDKEYSDILLFENDDLKVVNVRTDERIRLFFNKVPSDKIREELKAEKFAYASVFKAWQVVNDEDGKKKVDEFLKKHYKKETNNSLKLAKAKMKMAAARLKLK